MQYFDINALQVVCGGGRTGTPGFQPKFITGKQFIKQQCCIGTQLRDDYKVEVFASHIGAILNIPVIRQQSCVIDYHTYTRYGVVSQNLELTEHMQFCSFKYLMERCGVFVDTAKLRHSSALGKMTYLCELYVQALKIPKQVAEKYMLDTAIIDIIVGNADRHMRNFGAWLRNDGKYQLYPIFDNGLGFGQGVSDLRYCQTYMDYMRETYVAPYGEDPFDMLEILDSKYNIKRSILLPHIKQLSALGKMGYPNDFAKQYYHNILEMIKR